MDKIKEYNPFAKKKTPKELAKEAQRETKREVRVSGFSTQRHRQQFDRVLEEYLDIQDDGEVVDDFISSFCVRNHIRFSNTFFRLIYLSSFLLLFNVLCIVFKSLCSIISI